jgi:hypothetical protein
MPYLHRASGPRCASLNYGGSVMIAAIDTLLDMIDLTIPGRALCRRQRARRACGSAEKENRGHPRRVSMRPTIRSPPLTRPRASTTAWTNCRPPTMRRNCISDNSLRRSAINGA